MPATLRGVESGATRLGRLVRDSRRKLRLTQREAAERGGISEQTWGVIENVRADNFADLTLSAIDIALSWQPGAAQRVLDDPDYNPDYQPGPTSPNDQGADDLLEEVADLLRRVQEQLQSRRDSWDRLARGEDGNDHRRGGAR